MNGNKFGNTCVNQLFTLWHKISNIYIYIVICIVGLPTCSLCYKTHRLNVHKSRLLPYTHTDDDADD